MTRSIKNFVFRVAVGVAIALIVSFVKINYASALTWNLDTVGSFNAWSKAQSVTLSVSTTKTTVYFTSTITATDDFDFLELPISARFTSLINDDTHTTFTTSQIVRFQLTSADSDWAACELQSNLLICPVVEGVTYNGIYITSNFVDPPAVFSENTAIMIYLNNQFSLLQYHVNSSDSATAKNTEEINKSINDDSVTDSTENSSTYSSWSSSSASNGTISSLITLPLTLYTNILNNINGTCTDFSLGSLLGSNLTMPCIDLSDYLGSTLWGVIDVLFSGFFVLVISKKMIKVFDNMSSLKDGDILD